MKERKRTKLCGLLLAVSWGITASNIVMGHNKVVVVPLFGGEDSKIGNSGYCG